MDGAAVGIVFAVGAIGGLVWWAMHASRLDDDFIDHRADRAFRARTGRRPVDG
jgi:alpha-glucuronidase